MLLAIEGMFNTVDGKVMFLLSVLAFLLIFDFVVGVCVAKLDREIKFTSYKMKAGIITKIGEFVLCIVALPFSLLIEGTLELLIVGYIGLCLAEIYSILGHLKLVDDDKSSSGLEALFNNIFKKGGK